jgi:transcriptional regulator with XRE-family HTH domain
MRPLSKRRRKPDNFIREWRLCSGYTREQLANKVGITRGELSAVERGLSNYTQAMLEGLAESLQCDPADLIMHDPKSEIWSILDDVRRRAGKGA